VKGTSFISSSRIKPAGTSYERLKKKEGTTRVTWRGVRKSRDNVRSIKNKGRDESLVADEMFIFRSAGNRKKRRIG